MSRIPEQAITEAPDDGHGTKHTHPAFGTIHVSRVQGGNATLFQSDFEHQHYIALTVSNASLRRNLSNDWVHDEKVITEVYMSEHQWNTLIASPNMRGGPCTLNYIRGEGYVPRLPRVDRKQQFATEMEDATKESIASLQMALIEIDALGLSKVRADRLKAPIKAALGRLSSHVNFIVEQFGEHMERVVEEATQEIAGRAKQMTERPAHAALMHPGAEDHAPKRIAPRERNRS